MASNNIKHTETTFFLKLALIMAMFAAIAGLIMALSSQITTPLVLANKQKLENLARQKVVPGAEKFEENKLGELQYFKAFDKNNDLIGFVLKTKAQGYSSNIELLLGIDTKQSIIGLEIVDQAETPGLGTKIAEPKFRQQFLQKKAEELVFSKDGGSIDAITGATISSSAVQNGIKKILYDFNKLSKEEKLNK